MSERSDAGLQGADPIQPGPVPLSARVAPQRIDTFAMGIATVFGVAAYFSPGYVGRGSAVLTAPQLISAFDPIAGLCGQYWSVYAQSPGGENVCMIATLGRPLLWLEVLLAAATGIAGWQWYQRARSGMPNTRGVSWTVLLGGGIALRLLAYQILASPTIVGGAREWPAVGPAYGALFGYGFWLMVLGTVGVVVGAITQLRVSAASCDRCVCGGWRIHGIQ